MTDRDRVQDVFVEAAEIDAGPEIVRMTFFSEIDERGDGVEQASLIMARSQASDLAAQLKDALARVVRQGH